MRPPFLSHAFCSCLASSLAVGRHVVVKNPYVKECTFLMTALETLSSDVLPGIVFVSSCLCHCVCVIVFAVLWNVSPDRGWSVGPISTFLQTSVISWAVRSRIWSWWNEGNAPLEQLNACVVENGAPQEQWVSSLVHGLPAIANAQSIPKSLFV